MHGARDMAPIQGQHLMQGMLTCLSHMRGQILHCLQVMKKMLQIIMDTMHHRSAYRLEGEEL